MKIQNILVVDDHSLLLDGIKKLIENFVLIAKVRKESNPLKAVEILKKDKYDLLISDYEMPGLNGEELTKAVRIYQPDIKVLILSMHDQPYIINQLISLPINGYLLKKEMYGQLETAISEILNGRTFFSLEIDPINTKKPEPANLFSNRELEILKLISQRFSSNQIAEKLFLNQKTIETHEKNMVRKMKVKGRAELMRHAHQYVSLD